MRLLHLHSVATGKIKIRDHRLGWGGEERKWREIRFLERGYADHNTRDHVMWLNGTKKAGISPKGR